MSQPVFTYENAKTVKGEDLGFLTAIRYLAPADESGTNVCPNAGECAKVCLYTAGRGAFAQVKAARIAKTLWRLQDRAGHLAAAGREIDAAVKRAERMGKRLAVRLNGTSDLSADAITLARLHPHVQFYDYTKNVGVMQDYIARRLPENYHLTLSFDPSTVPWERVVKLLAFAHSVGGKPFGVAVCFNTKRGKDLPEVWNGVEVIDGDTHDLRFIDKTYSPLWIVGLRAKGAAKKPGLSTFTVSV